MNKSETQLRTNPRIVPQDLLLKFGYSADTGIKFDSAAVALSFYQGGTQRVDIRSFGLAVRDGEGLVVGHTAQVAADVDTAEFQVLGTGADSFATLVRWSENGGAPQLTFAKSRGTTVGTFGTAVNNGDTLGQITWVGDDGTDANSQAAKIAAQVDGAPGANDMPGRLVFSTTPDGASSVTEAMRIDSSQRVGIGASNIERRLHIVADFNQFGIDDTGSDTRFDINVDSAGIELKATGKGSHQPRDLVFSTNTGSGILEALRINSSQNSVFSGYMIPKITDTDGTVEGSIWYDASEDKLKFKTATGVETITSA